jgi:hypothetical protein
LLVAVVREAHRIGRTSTKRRQGSVSIERVGRTRRSTALD